MVKFTENSNGLDGGTFGELLDRCWNGDLLINALMRPHPVEIPFEYWTFDYSGCNDQLLPQQGVLGDELLSRPR